MEIIEVNQEGESEPEESAVEEALQEAGLSYVKAPKVGTEAYRRLVRAAEFVRPPQSQSDRDDYFRPKSKPLAPISSSGTERRKYHQELCVMLLGESPKEIPKDLANRVSDFAAYVTGDERYVGKW